MDLDASGLQSVLDLAGWAHAEWVRIHPFANGSGRTARILANALFMRYGLPPAISHQPSAISPRSRPQGGYERAGEEAMSGRWLPMVAVLKIMLTEALTGT